MKHLLAIVLMGGAMLMGLELADFKPVEKVDAQKKEQNKILTFDFEKGLPSGMTQAKGYQCGWGFGENGNGGLFLKRGPGEKYVFSQYEVQGLKQGFVYRFSASVKLTGIKTTEGKPVANMMVPVIGFDLMDG